MIQLLRKMRFFWYGVAALFVAGAAMIGPGLYRGAMTIHELLTEKQTAQAGHRQPDRGGSDRLCEGDLAAR
jgi:hypothetical protein